MIELPLEPASIHFFWMAVAGFGGFLLGLLIHFLFSRTTRIRLEAEIALRDERLANEASRTLEREAAFDSAQDTLAAAFNELANASLERNSEHFLRLAGQKFEVHQEKARSELGARTQAVETLIKPIREALDQTREQIHSLEKAREHAYGSISEQLQAMTQSQESLRSETSKLVGALRRPTVRGQWGEVTLRRLAELAGMVHHCDFAEQVHTRDDDNRGYRPDMIIRLPEEGQLVVDAKTSLDAYLDATEATDDSTRREALKRHAANVSAQVKQLAGKSYTQQFDKSPEFVILFVPGDQFLSAALDEKPGLLEEALAQKVLLATPTSLIALLKVVAYGWMQLNLTENAEVIRKLAVDMQDRLSVFTGHLATVGTRLDASVNSYNKAVASLESRVLPATRRIRELGADPGKETPEPSSIDVTTRDIKAPTDTAADEEDTASPA